MNDSGDGDNVQPLRKGQTGEGAQASSSGRSPVEEVMNATVTAVGTAFVLGLAAGAAKKGFEMIGGKRVKSS